MEFNGQYLTYEEYRALGGTLDLMPFNLLEFEARKQIDIRTQNRLKNNNGENIPQEVKLCVNSLISTINNYANSIEGTAKNGNIASESIDGYSVNYINLAQINQIIQSKSAEMDDIIRTYLLNVIYNGEHLMYIGVK